MICKRPGFTEEAFPQAGGPTLEAGIYRPRVVFRAGEKAVDTGESGRGKRCLKRKNVSLGEDAERAESCPPPTLQLVARDRLEIVERLPDRLPQEPRSRIRVGLGPARRHRHDPVDDAEFEAVRGVGLEPGGGLLL